jgi:hypothetical protein
MRMSRCVQYSSSMSYMALIIVCTGTGPLVSLPWKLTASVYASHHNSHQFPSQNFIFNQAFRTKCLCLDIKSEFVTAILFRLYSAALRGAVGHAV